MGRDVARATRIGVVGPDPADILGALEHDEVPDAAFPEPVARPIPENPAPTITTFAWFPRFPSSLAPTLRSRLPPPDRLVYTSVTYRPARAELEPYLKEAVTATDAPAR